MTNSLYKGVISSVDSVLQLRSFHSSENISNIYSFLKSCILLTIEKLLFPLVIRKIFLKQNHNEKSHKNGLLANLGNTKSNVVF